MTESMMNGMHLQLPMNLNSDLFWRYPLSLNALTPTATFGDSNLKLPKSLGLDPRTWNREDVALFLQWCKSEFDLPALDIEKFKMNGKALILLNKSDISQRAPGTGDVIHNILQLLLKPVAIRRGLEEANLHSGHNNNNTHLPASLMGWPSPTSLLTPAELHSIIQQRNSAALSPPASAENRSQPGSPPRSDPATAAAAAAVAAHLTLYTQALQASLQAAETQSDSEEDPQESSPRRSPTSASCYPKASASPPVATSVDTPDSGSNGRLLWDFLQQLLNDPGQRYTAYIAWKNRETGVFKITDPPGLARLWGFQKNHPSMNYDKMSRALRYYYRVNILRKVQGERHCYQFLRNNNELKSVKSLSQLRHEPPGTLSSKLEENSEILAGYDYSISSKMKMVP